MCVCVIHDSCECVHKAMCPSDLYIHIVVFCVCSNDFNNGPQLCVSSELKRVLGRWRVKTMLVAGLAWRVHSSSLDFDIDEKEVNK